MTGGRRDFTLDASPAMLTVYSRPYTAWYRPGDGNSYWVYSPADVTVYQQKFGKYVSNANYKGDLTGYVEYTRTPRHNHETTASGWTAADGGERLTFDGQKAHFDAYTLWNDNLGMTLGVGNGILQTVTDTEISFYDEADVTLEATVEVSSMSFDSAEGLIINGTYTLFAKAGYKDETGLTPTFHSLTPVAYDLTTGVASVMAESARVEAGPGCIRIGNYVGLVSVYNIQGAKVYEGRASEIPAAPGAYVVKAGKTTAKLIVR